MKRRMFNLLVGLSLLLCLGTSALWMRSIYIGDRFGWTKTAGPQGRRGEIASARGTINYSQDTATDPFISAGDAEAPGAGWEHGDASWILHEADNYAAPVSGPFHRWHFCGVSLDAWNAGCLTVSIPDRIVVLFTAPMPVLWVYMKLRFQRSQQLGLCPKCGYDLRATPHRCPECGKTPTIPLISSFRIHHSPFGISHKLDNLSIRCTI